MNSLLESSLYIVYASQKILVSNPDGMLDEPEIMDWLEELGENSYSMSFSGAYVYFYNEEDMLAFKLKFGL